MTKKLLLPILTLLLLVGCTSELDRCIEANTGNLENNLKEKNQKFRDEHVDEDGEWVEGWLDAYRDFEANVFTDFERELGECVGDKIDTYMDKHNLDFSVQSEANEYRAKTEEFAVSCEKSVPLERVERATKICNAQGIY
jgi:hypothetical protein